MKVMILCGARVRAWVRLLTCFCLLLCFGGLAATPLAGLLPGKNDCNCGCQHENGKPCCCRRAAREAGPTFESEPTCPGNCRSATLVPLRVGLFLPLPRRNAGETLTTVSRAAVSTTQTQRDILHINALRDRSPPGTASPHESSN